MSECITSRGNRLGDAGACTDTSADGHGDLFSGEPWVQGLPQAAAASPFLGRPRPRFTTATDASPEPGGRWLWPRCAEEDFCVVGLNGSRFRTLFSHTRRGGFSPKGRLPDWKGQALSGSGPRMRSRLFFQPRNKLHRLVLQVLHRLRRKAGTGAGGPSLRLQLQDFCLQPQSRSSACQRLSAHPPRPPGGRLRASDHAESAQLSSIPLRALPWKLVHRGGIQRVKAAPARPIPASSVPGSFAQDRSSRLGLCAARTAPPAYRLMPCWHSKQRSLGYLGCRDELLRALMGDRGLFVTRRATLWGHPSYPACQRGPPCRRIEVIREALRAAGPPCCTAVSRAIGPRRSRPLFGRSHLLRQAHASPPSAPSPDSRMALKCMIW
jgi:hypothetical protein